MSLRWLWEFENSTVANPDPLFVSFSTPSLSLATHRRLLCEDWYLVTRRRRLVPVPRKPSVLDIVRSFEKQQQQQQVSKN